MTARGHHDAYLFDCFGTLVTDNKEFFELIWNRHFGGYRAVYVPLMRPILFRNNYSSEESALDKMLALTGRTMNGQQRAGFLSDMQSWRHSLNMWAGASDVLGGLRRQGKRLALVSNQTNFTEAVLDNHGLVQCFDVVLRSHHIGQVKPNREIYGTALEKLGVEPRQALMIGDNLEEDTVAPRRFGLDAVLFDPQNLHPDAIGRANSWRHFKAQYMNS